MTGLICTVHRAIYLTGVSAQVVHTSVQQRRGPGPRIL